MRFEYKVISMKRNMWSSKTETTDARFQDQLNKLGTLGWELVSTSLHGITVQAFLKRQK